MPALKWIYRAKVYAAKCFGFAAKAGDTSTTVVGPVQQLTAELDCLRTATVALDCPRQITVTLSMRLLVNTHE